MWLSSLDSVKKPERIGASAEALDAVRLCARREISADAFVPGTDSLRVADTIADPDLEHPLGGIDRTQIGRELFGLVGINPVEDARRQLAIKLQRFQKPLELLVGARILAAIRRQVVQVETPMHVTHLSTDGAAFERQG